MGEAKNRGSFQNRQKNAREVRNKALPTHEDIRDLGLPPNSRFIGYVVHRLGKDDFFSKVNGGKGLTTRVYSWSPEYAQKFSSFEDALSVANNLQVEARVGRRYDIGERFAVAFDEVTY